MTFEIVKNTFEPEKINLIEKYRFKFFIFQGSTL